MFLKYLMKIVLHSTLTSQEIPVSLGSCCRNLVGNSQQPEAEYFGPNREISLPGFALIVGLRNRF